MPNTLICDNAAHRPVLPRECVEALRVKPDGRYVDATVGWGGHSKLILDALGPEGRLIAVDRDPAALQAALQRLGDRPLYVLGNFDRFDEKADLGPASVDGILADLGVSSPQLDVPERGFSWMRPGPLDMRMNPTAGVTAREWMARATLAEWETCLRAAGEDRFAKKLARRLHEDSPRFLTTEDLASAVARWVPRRGHSHPATRVFLALRMAVNDELESLKRFLSRAIAVLKPGGRLAVISFHSGEDRIVKWFGREGAGQGTLTILTKKPVEPSDTEQRDNPRSRSAKLRVFEKRGDDLS